MELLIALDIFSEIAKITELRSPLISLISHLKTLIPSVCESLDEVVSEMPESPRRQAAKPDRSAILRRYAESRDRFEQSSRMDLESMEPEAEENVVTCVACHGTIDVERDIYGMIWTGRSIHLCPHLGHLHCYREFECPLCKTAGGLFTPILSVGCTEEQKAVARQTISIMVNQNFEGLVEQMGQRLDFESSTTLPNPFVQLMRTIIITAADSPPEMLAPPPLLVFASLLPKTRDFESLVRMVWESRPCPKKSAGIVWNCWVMSGDSGLDVLDLERWKSPAPDFYLSRLPERFSDFFLKEFGGEDLLGFQLWEGSICRCLQCGKCLRISSREPLTVQTLLTHIDGCPLGLVLSLMGPDVTGIFRIDVRPGNIRIKQMRPVYVTEEGDEDVGLTLGAQLVLSQERRRSLMKEIMSGVFYG
jgi:hypothetical protein